MWETRESANETNRETSMKHFGCYSIEREGNAIAKSIEETIRTIGTQNQEKECSTDKFECKCDLVDIKAWKLF